MTPIGLNDLKKAAETLPRLLTNPAFENAGFYFARMVDSFPNSVLRTKIVSVLGLRTLRSV